MNMTSAMAWMPIFGLCILRPLGALLLPNAAGDRLSARFELAYGRLDVKVEVTSSPEADVDRVGFAWTVLGALASDVDVQSADGHMTIGFSKRRVAGVA